MAAQRRNGITRSILLPRSIDERLNVLCETVGMNRNQLVRLVAEKATPDDIRTILAR